MMNPFIALAINILLRAKWAFVEHHLRPLIDHRAGIAGKRHTVLLALEEVLAHLRPDFFEEKAQMRGDRIVAQHRVALLREIANAKQGERAKDQQRDEDQIECLVVDDPDPEKQRRHHGANRKNDVAWRERKHQRFHGTPQAVSAILLFIVVTQWSGFDIRYPPRRELVKRMSNPELH